jgi:uncharacterized protein DUF6174
MIHRLRNVISGARMLVGGLAVTAVVACADQAPGTPIDHLADAMVAWEQRGPDSYTYAIERQCFCTTEARGPVRVTVVNGVVVGRVYVDSGLALTGEAQNWFPDVAGLFEVIGDAINQGAHQLTVTYDADTGVPLDLWIDYEENVADEELGFRVTEQVTPTS